jgi:thiosulfate/3-mercaptopyruvate sulfurtransferase
MLPLRRALLVLLLAGLSGCAALRPAAPPDDRLPEQPGILVGADWLAEHLGASDLAVLHVARERSDYEEGHVPGARFLAVSDFAPTRSGLPFQLPELDALRAAFEAVGVSDDTRVVLYGDLGGLSATRAFFSLEVLGHARASVLDGGLAAWEAEGQPLAREAAPEPAPGTLTASPRPDLAVVADVVLRRIDDEGTALVDARPPAEFSGESAGEGIERPGRIPSAANVFWQTTLAREGPPVFLPREELRQRYARAGATPERELVVYCRTGMQASHAYFTARLLGLDVRLYDGSYFEWSNRTDYPTWTGS